MTPARVTLRELTAEERQALEQLAASRTARARFVERARIVLALADGRRPSQVARELGLSRPTVYIWLHRFNDRGLHGLEDQPRAGRPPTYTAEQRAEVIAAALADPKQLGRPFGCWTLDRLQTYLNEQKGIPIKRSRSDELLRAEGLRWRHQETWFGERVDPAFAERRGSSRRSTPTRRPARPSSASTRWGRGQPRATPAKSPSAPRRAESRGRRPPPRRASPAGGRLRPARQGVHLRRLPPGHRRGADPALRQPVGGQLGRLPGAGRGLGPGRCRAGLRDRRRPPGAPGHRRAAVEPGAPAVGVRLPAEVRGVPEPDRAVVEGAQVAGVEGPAVRDLGRGVPRRRRGDGLRERASASVRLGPPTATPAAPPPRHRGRP